LTEHAFDEAGRSERHGRGRLPRSRQAAVSASTQSPAVSISHAAKGRRVGRGERLVAAAARGDAEEGIHCIGRVRRSSAAALASGVASSSTRVGVRAQQEQQAMIMVCGGLRCAAPARRSWQRRPKEWSPPTWHSPAPARHIGCLLRWFFDTEVLCRRRPRGGHDVMLETHASTDPSKGLVQWQGAKHRNYYFTQKWCARFCASWNPLDKYVVWRHCILAQAISSLK